MQLKHSLRRTDWVCGPNDVDDTRERKKREAVTETRQKRLLKKRTIGDGSKEGKAATELGDADANHDD